MIEQEILIVSFNYKDFIFLFVLEVEKKLGCDRVLLVGRGSFKK